MPERLWQMGASALSTRSFAEEPSVCTLWISCPTTGRCAATLQSGACTSSLMLVVRSWMMLSEVESPPVSPFLRLSFKTDACAMRTVESDLTFWAERKSRKPDTPQATMSTAMTTATTVPATCRRRGGSGSKRGARPRDWGAALARTTPCHGAAYCCRRTGCRCCTADGCWELSLKCLPATNTLLTHRQRLRNDSSPTVPQPKCIVGRIELPRNSAGAPYRGPLCAAPSPPQPEQLLTPCS